jgi:membrane protein
MSLVERGKHRKSTARDREPDARRPPSSPLEDRSPSDPHSRGYLAVVRGALKRASRDHITSFAAALAYYGFLAIPSALLVALGLFSLFASPDAVTTLVDKLATIMPSEATGLVRDSLTQMTERDAAGATLVGIGGVLAVWALGGAMQNVMWALNAVYERDETRGFVRRRLTAWAMVVFAVLGFSLAFGLLVLGPALSAWLGNELGARTVVGVVWWTAQWPLLVGGLLVAFAGILYLGPNVHHRSWRLLSFGAIVAVLLWLASSGAFAFYVSYFGSYNKTWGSLSAVVILLTWLWLSGLALLFGAEIDAEAERSRQLRRQVSADAAAQPEPQA